jgi:hypothetical protein
MPKKNIIIQIYETASGKTRFLFYIIFYLGWKILLMRHQQAWNKGAIFHHQLQTVSNTDQKYFSKIIQRKMLIPQ